MNNKIKIEQAKQQISEGFSTIYSKEDVLHLLDCLETNSDFKLTADQIEDLSETISSNLIDENIDIVEDYELDLNGHEIELDRIYLSDSRIREIVYNIIEDFSNSLK